MKAVKENKVYNITEVEKATFLKHGYNIADEKGEIVEYSPLATVPYSQYMKVVKELEELKASKKKSVKKDDAE